MYSLLVLPLLLQATVTYGEWITVPNGARWGDWGPPQRCPNGTVAKAFSEKDERIPGPEKDASGLNGVMLYCTDRGDTRVKGVITSAVGHRGQWSRPTWCRNGYITGFVLKAEKEKRDEDNAAAISLKVKCSSLGFIRGRDRPLGVYGSPSEICRRGVCGIRTKVQCPQGSRDDTGLTDIALECC